ncbi:cholecystokinin-like isoform X2 [Dunckerocampus dactyliophorus]|uniref:cholecystokinin-like isoform X2 n=1 Tax=Dunckerocampus dactyliophorus TaxID=161453 RepID=UPI002404C3C1|nr:cholecystokinin-like isoform X2 [Dunckerocampus dactyliophorus]
MHKGMNVIIYVVVFLAAVSRVSLGLPSQSIPHRSDSAVVVSDGRTNNHTRQARSADPPSRQLSNPNQAQEDVEALNTLRQLLARLISRKGLPYQSRSSITSRASGLAPQHRINNRDYEGWLDFGRRSAEEYEYS